MKKKLLLFIAIFPAILFSQEEITVMHYNLLMYGNYTSWCTSTNNPYLEKTEYLKTIVEYVNPDILTVNEISDNTFYHNYLLDNALNVNGANYFQMGNPSNVGNSYIMNQIYYNSEKFQFHSYSVVPTNVRDIDIFTLYFLTPDLKFTNDTVFLNCIVAHLKAGSYPENEAERANETNLLMNHLEEINATGNYLFLGDFNLYSNAEPAFQNLINFPNEDIRFYDPLNKMGSWHNNSYYEDIHTQSTHTGSGCPSGGGMDDRFDFILASDEILEGADHVEYIEDSYLAIGQDGQHFNQSLISSPTNTSVPADVLEALYGMSDHLPIRLKLLIDNNVGIAESGIRDFNISTNNPVSNNLSLRIAVRESSRFQIEICNLWGQRLYSETVSVSSSQTILIPMKAFMPGMYMLRVIDDKQNMLVKKIMKD
jgi:endonuclease/exonuclease/phosphatase family metal-dependent hydrolase